MEFEAPEYAEEGVAEFQAFIEPSIIIALGAVRVDKLRQVHIYSLACNRINGGCLAIAAMPRSEPQPVWHYSFRIASRAESFIARRDGYRPARTATTTDIPRAASASQMGMTDREPPADGSM